MRGSPGIRGFTLMELLTVIVITGILMSMIIPIYTGLRGKAERGACAQNLYSLYAAGSAYVRDQGHWPQIPTKDIGKPAYSAAWVRAFEPYNIGEDNWACPTIKRMFGSATAGTKPLEERARIDYFATPFDDNPVSPTRYPTQPWFVERGDPHGDGNLLIFANGQLSSLGEYKRAASKP